MLKILSLEENKLDIKYFLGLILVALVFSISVRYIWVDTFKGVESFKWNNEIMINTNDGYYFAEGARDILSGIHQENDRSPISDPLAKLTAYLSKILPFSFETTILWMPAFFGSLLVIPVMLISRSLNQEYLGFTAALLAGIAWSYYNRTMVGYYDTDMLVIVLPTFVLWAVIFNLQEQRNRYLLLIPFFMLSYSWWYPGSYSLNMAMTFMVFFYTIAFDRKNLFNYKILIFMLVSIALITVTIKSLIIISLFLVFHFKKEFFNEKIVFALLAIAFIFVLVTGGFSPIITQIKGYVFREAYASDIFETLKLNYFAVNQTVREAGEIPFEVFANRISGHTITFVLSVIGYVLLSLRYKIMWLALPMVGLGFLALKGGLRFTVYAVPIMALGMAYLIFLFSKIFNTFVYNDRTLKVFKVGFISILTILVLYPNIKHIQNYKVPTVFNKQEVLVLDKFKDIASREDYVVTWWDYGYPIRYYSDVKTLIDGGKHTGKDNFAISYSLLSDQTSSANMARLEVEYTERAFKEKFDSNLIQMMKDYNKTDVNDFLQFLQFKDMKLPSKTRDVYFYFPDRMLGILPTVSLFSNLNLMTGEKYRGNLFYQSQRFKSNNGNISLGNGITLFLNKGQIKISNRVLKINNFIVTNYDKNGKLKKAIQTVDKSSPISVIYMKNYNRFLVVDNKMLNSTYIQLYVLENHDKTLYEPVLLTPRSKIYRLKK